MTAKRIQIENRSSLSNIEALNVASDLVETEKGTSIRGMIKEGDHFRCYLAFRRTLSTVIIIDIREDKEAQEQYGN